MKYQGKALTMAIVCALMGAVSLPSVYAAEEIGTVAKDEVDTYALDDVTVNGERVQAIANPYITGGDVNVITRQDIEKHNYGHIEDALKTIPGVQVATPGYRGGEYGYSSYNTELSINGENSIIVLVDGRRVDSDASSYAGNKSRVSLSTLPGMDDIEQIEVIKGGGAAIYGPDAAGGVINIITRKGTQKSKTTLDVSAGSWHYNRFSLTHTGSADQGTLSYSVSVSRQQRGDSYYKDAAVNQNEKYNNTQYRDENIAVNVAKTFDAAHSLELTYNHAYEDAHYPITAPDYQHIDAFYKGTMAAINPTTHRYIGLNSSVAGYRNIFLYDAMLGSHDRSLTNNVDLKYVFSRTDEKAESYIRVYRNYTRYDMDDYSSIWNVPYTYLNEFLPTAKDSVSAHTDMEEVTGTVLQLAQHRRQHSIAGGFDYRTSKYTGWDSDGNYTSNRHSWNLYMQDKIKLSKKFTLTPGLNYAYFSAGNYNIEHFAAAHRLNFSLYGSYDFDKATNAYISASQIFKPISGSDYSRSLTADPLEEETGWNCNAGVSRTFGLQDTVSLNYGLTDMDNAIARYSVWNGSKWKSRAVNAKRNKQAFNIAYNHVFNDAWKAGISYAWVNEDFHTKNVTKNPDGTNPDELINAYRPRNVYRLHVSYDKDKWFGDLAYTIYSGNNTQYFTSSHFNVLDLSLSYRFNTAVNVYLNVNNILNEAYETKALAAYGPGALPESGRSFVLGVKYSF